MSDQAGEFVAILTGGPTRHRQWSYFLRNPQGGGFGTNLGSGRPMRAAWLNAVSTLPPGTRYRLEVNGRDRGCFIRGHEPAS